MTLKGISYVAAIGVGGYYAYTGIMGFAGKIKEVGEDAGEFLAGRPTQHGAALGGHRIILDSPMTLDYVSLEDDARSRKKGIWV